MCCECCDYIIKLVVTACLQRDTRSDLEMFTIRQMMMLATANLGDRGSVSKDENSENHQKHRRIREALLSCLK